MSSSVEDSGEESGEFESDWEYEDEEIPDMFKTYSFVYVDRNVPENEKCNRYLIPRREKKLRKPKAKDGPDGAGDDGGEQKIEEIVLDEDDSEAYDSDGSSVEEGDGPKFIRLVPTLRAMEAMRRLEHWENTSRLGALQAAGADICAKNCIQAGRPCKLPPKFKIPGPWVQCATEHFSGMCYGKDKEAAKAEEEPKPGPSKALIKFPPLRPKPNSSHVPGCPNSQATEDKVGKANTCKYCSCWRFEHYDEPEMYYQDYLERVTYRSHKDHDDRIESFPRILAEAANRPAFDEEAEMINMAYAFQNELTPDEMKIKVKGKGRREPSESSVRKAKPSADLKQKYADIKSRYLIPKALPKVEPTEPLKFNPVQPPPFPNIVSKIPRLPFLQPVKRLYEEPKYIGWGRPMEGETFTLPAIPLKPKFIHPLNPPTSYSRRILPGWVSSTNSNSFSVLSKAGGDIQFVRRWITPMITKKMITKKKPKTTTKSKKKKPSGIASKKTSKKGKKSRKTKKPKRSPSEEECCN